MSFTLVLELKGIDLRPAGEMYVRPARALLDADPSGPVVYLGDRRTFTADSNGVIRAEVASADEVEGSVYYSVTWPGHSAPTWVPAQADGVEENVRSWVDEPSLPAPEVPQLIERVRALEEDGGTGGGGGGSYDDGPIYAALLTETQRAQGAEQTNTDAISTHTARVDNPHAVTKAQVGLSQVANLAPAALPVSTAQQTALDGKADLVGGVVPTSQIPAVALTTAQVVADRAAMLAVTNVQQGDIVAISSGADRGTYVLGSGDPTTFTSWVPLVSPTDVVQTVNGQQGTVVLGAGDVGALAAANNLSDVPAKATARSNLGLGSAATMASSTFATSAQGTKADNAATATALTSEVSRAQAAEKANADAIALKVNTADVYGKAASDSRYGVRVPASGDTTGATDRAAINAALVVGARVNLVHGATYYIDAPLYLRTRTALDATGAVVNQVGRGFNMLRNAAVDGSRTVTDASATSNGFGGGDTTVVSPAANFTATDVGSKVGIVGGGYGGSVWYGTIVSVTSATQAVVSCRVQTTISGAALTIYPNRDTDISLRGGSWNGTAALADGHNASETALTNHWTCFRRVDRMTIRDMTWTTANAANQSGGRFTLSCGDVTDLDISKIWFISTAGDGVHVQGPARSVSVTDIYGKTNDDMVVCNTSDSYTPTITDTQGDVVGFVTDRVFPNGSLSAFKVYNTDAYNIFRIDSMTAQCLKGTATNGVRLDGDSFGNTYGVVVRDVALVTGSAATPVVSVNSTRQQDVLVENVVWMSNSSPTGGIVSLNVRSGTVRNVSMNYSPNSGTGIGVRLPSGTGYQNIVVEGVRFTGSPATFYALQCQGGTHQNLTIRNVSLTSTNGRILDVSAGTQFNKLTLEDCQAATPTLATLASATAVAAIRVLNCLFSGTSLISTGQPLTLTLLGSDVTTSGAVVAVVGANATPVRVRQNSSAQAGAGALLSRDGTQALSATGAGIGVDQTILSPADGDEIVNSNSTPANGVGRALWNAAAGKWKNLYSGVTN